MSLLALELLDRVREGLGGGNLTIYLVVGGLVAVYLAYRAAKFAVKLVALGTAAVLFLGTAPWAGEPITGAAAECAAAIVEREAAGWQQHLTKRITVAELSGDAACADADVGLSAGTATVKLRSFWDVPFQTWEVTPDGATPRTEMPDLPAL